MSAKAALSRLKRLLGSRCLTDKLSRVQYSYDATQLQYEPDVVVLPESTKEVSEVLKIASKYRIPVVPRGWGSGFTGGCLNVRGGIALSLERMDAIVSFDQENMLVRVQAGIANYRLQEFLRPFGLMFPPDPSSWKFSSIGGNIAENAGGPRAVKYGVTKNWVKALQIVLADGTVMEIGSANVKDVAGYDLVDLIVGSEGTLAVVTEALLRLHPLPECVKTIQVIFNDIQKAAETVFTIMKNRIIPTALEFVDRAAINATREALQLDLPTDADAMLIIDIDGSKAQVEEETKKLVKLIKGSDGVVDFKVAKDSSEAEELWLARRSISPTLKRIADGKINEDIVVPLSKIATMIKKTQEISRRYRLPIINFGHAGDGNIHVNIMYHKDNNDEKRRAIQAMDDVFKSVLQLGGSITGEHGVGITKKDYIEMQVGTPAMELMRRIKKAFDPDNILNPGKMGL